MALVDVGSGENSDTPRGRVTTVAGSDESGPKAFSAPSSSLTAEEPLRCDSTHGGWKPSDTSVVDVVVVAASVVGTVVVVGAVVVDDGTVEDVDETCGSAFLLLTPLAAEPHALATRRRHTTPALGTPRIATA